jgi:hypothetical protein
MWFENVLWKNCLHFDRLTHCEIRFGFKGMNVELKFIIQRIMV